MRMPLTWRIPKALIDLAEKNKILSFKSWESRAVLLLLSDRPQEMFFFFSVGHCSLFKGSRFVAVQKLYRINSVVGWIVTESWEWTSSCNTLIFLHLPFCISWFLDTLPTRISPPCFFILIKSNPLADRYGPTELLMSFSSLIIPSSMLTARSILRWGRRNPWIGSWSPPEKFQVPFHGCKG